MSDAVNKGSEIIIEPAGTNPTLLGKLHVVGEPQLTVVQVELLLQQALAYWQRNH